MDNEINLPQPNEISATEKERAMASYFMMFASSTIGLPLPFMNLIASWIFYRYTSKTSQFVRFHSYQSMLSQLPITVFNTVLVFWTLNAVWGNFPLISENDFSPILNNFSSNYFGFLIVTILSNLIYMVFSVIAGIKAYKGQLYYFPYFGNIAFEQAFVNFKEFGQKEFTNTSPKL